ncbi:ABC transporter ATP-binding protein [Clostridium sp. FP1]|uniref:ABC transporter ATP-binding protein n=1 Tax=Clostridium sp. FP1 TaxID=2724076 RepID=UPI0013E97FCD|nr:ABC transporter ATP-binding protein [Clostridium sp. FP1]MBZ9633599.1 ABC transporter ATP-binding protein [Clostridium sp. FP1]
MENIDFRKNTLLEVKNLKCYFNDSNRIFKKNNRVIKAVDGLSFKINKGEVYGLVGESGCGKSTTGRAILNLIPKVGGALSFDGNLIYDVENKYSISGKKMQKTRKDMQMIFQDPYSSLDSYMNIGSIIKQGMLKHGLLDGKEVRVEIKKILELCGLSGECIDKYPHEFSGGERQRIVIARALALKPKFLVCDEPTSALDVSIQAQILMLMDSLKKEMKLTYLFISHNLSLVRYFCDRVAVMYLGNIVEESYAEELFLNPKHPYTKCLISSIPKTHPREKKFRIIMKDEIPNGDNLIKGCKFNTRCPYASEICKYKVPTLKEVTKGHFVACHEIV